VPDFLITDWQMPGMDGLELCRAVRQEPLDRYVYLMIATGKSETKNMVQAIAAGADSFLAKPVIPGELLAQLMSAARILDLQQRLSELAQRDPLTKLLNRRTFFQLFEQQWMAMTRDLAPLSCVMIDIDFFKRINDTYGHPTGDSVLESLGRILRACCRQSDSVCRYGGEEFCALLPGTNVDDALCWARRCCDVIRQTPMLTKAGPLNVTASLGIATRNPNVHSPEQLLDHADQALLAAKRLGRNRTEQFLA
jgi:diguanylate cyclase (GGDEF)-like protein